jgi:uncharacterized phage protein (TIGR02218 family)
MRNVSAELRETLEGAGMFLAVCVSITRTDSESLYFTSWDSALEIDGNTYSPLNSVTASDAKTSAKPNTDNLEVIGILSAESLTEADVLAGRYDGAAVRMFWVNPVDLSQGVIGNLTGTVGNITLRDGQYTAEILGTAHNLQQHAKLRTSETCRVSQLGNTRCGVNLAGFTHTGTIYASTDTLNMTVGSMAQATGYFSGGIITFTSGANDGISREIKTHTLTTGRAVLVLQEPFPFSISNGDGVTLVAGCDRTIGTCQTKFSNAARFDGEPYLPLEDKVQNRGVAR